ncbi:Wzy polymerase domain-containing protein [Erwinia amylovora]
MTRLHQQIDLSRLTVFTLLLGLVIYFLLLQHLYIPNMGGSGLTLPLNLITWSLMLFICALLSGYAGLRNRLVCGKEIWLGLLAAALMTLPICWTPAVNYPNALPRVAAIWGALFFSLALQQVSFKAATKRAILALIMLSALAECLSGLFQWGWPTTAHQLMEYNISRMAGRPYGIFQQPNLLASFIATGYAIAVYFTLSQAAFRRKNLLLLFVQAVMLWVLLLTGSRVGIYGAILSLFLLSAIAPELHLHHGPRPVGNDQRRSVPVRWLVILVLIMVGLLVNVAGGLINQPSQVAGTSVIIVLLGMVWCCQSTAGSRHILISQLSCFAIVVASTLLFLHPSSFSFSDASAMAPGGHDLAWPTHDLLHAGSSAERLNMLKGSLRLVSQHPWAGVGLGGFESAFATIRQYPELDIASYTVTHPHNELIYVLVEGGPVGLAGLLLMAVACFLPALKTLVWRQASVNKVAVGTQRDSLAVAVMLLPIALHVLLEYPFYQSAAHLLVFLLLIRIGQPDNQQPSPQQPVLFHRKPPTVGLRITLFGFSLAFLLAALAVTAGLRVEEQLTLAERGALRSLPVTQPSLAVLTQYDRYDFDQHTRQLLQYNISHDPQLLNRYTQWGENYLKVHNDAGVYDAMIRIARYQGHQQLAEDLATSARLSFYRDSRFAYVPDKTQ